MGSRLRTSLALLLLAPSACSGAGTTTSSAASGSAAASAGATSSAAASSGPSSGSSAGAGSSSGSSLPPAGDGGSCRASTLAGALGKNHTLIGFSGQDSTASAAPFDLRYIYLSGGLFDGTSPCASCATNCTANGTSCANSAGGCAWWGCWQYDQDPPGETARDLVSGSQALNQIPMFTYYQILQASGLQEGTTEVAAINDQAFLERYLADFRFLLQQIGNSVAFVHVEPDFWGYAEQLNSNPHDIPATVPTSNPTDCASMEASAAGFGQCLIAMARKYAPKAKIGLHASSWGSGMNVLDNANAGLDVTAEAQKIATFLTACGATAGDFIVSDISDRDAAYYTSIGQNTWWDATNATLPNFHQAWAYGGALGAALHLPVLYWQVPVGNMQLTNVCNHWQDNRVDYLMAHLDELAQSNAIGVAFGAGATCMTTPESDNGNLISLVKAATPEPVCGQ